MPNFESVMRTKADVIVRSRFTGHALGKDNDGVCPRSTDELKNSPLAPAIPLPR